MTKQTKSYLSIVGLLYCSVILGTHYIVTKQISSYVDASMLTAYRFLIAAIPLYIYILYIKKNPFQNIKPGVILGFFLWLVFILIVTGLKYTSAINTGFISGMFFVFVPLVNYLAFKKHLKLFLMPVIILSIIGLYLLTGGLSALGLGDILILFSAVFTAIHLVLVGHYSKEGLDPVVVCFQQFAVVALLSVVFAFLTNKFDIFVPVSQIGPLLFLGILPTLSVFFVQMVSLKYASEITGAVLLSLQPGFAAFFSYWLGGERFTTLQLLGGVLLFFSAIIYSFLTQGKKNIEKSDGQKIDSID
ncbi:MAG: DMT family transporter [Candidatus Paceibacterota bacterium]|jgi:drug/metabolite transporter (DMT)-like permease